MTIRIATTADLPALAQALGQERFFADRLDRQRDGRGMLLVAWRRDSPVGDVYLWLEPAEEPEVRERLPGVPLLQHLEVRDGHRNRRIGSALIRIAERILRRRGYRRVALGVTLDNHGAARLYRRHHYREWPYPPISATSAEFLPDGRRRLRSEICQIFVKDLLRPRQHVCTG